MTTPGQFLHIPVPGATQGQVSGLQFQQPRKLFPTGGKGEMKKSSIFFSNPKSNTQEIQGASHTSSFGLQFKEKMLAQGGNVGQQPQLATTGTGGLLAPSTGEMKPLMYSSQIIKPST